MAIMCYLIRYICIYSNDQTFKKLIAANCCYKYAYFMLINKSSAKHCLPHNMLPLQINKSTNNMRFNSC